jgi:hypothetical protein
VGRRRRLGEFVKKASPILKSDTFMGQYSIFFTFCKSKIDHVTLWMMDGINSTRTVSSGFIMATQQSGANRNRDHNELFSSKHG